MRLARLPVALLALRLFAQPAPAPSSAPASAPAAKPVKSAPAAGVIVSVRWVRLFVRVQDESGRAVSGLPREAFKVFENGKPVNDFDFLVKQPPLRLILLLDCSRSMTGERLESLRAAARALLDALSPGDEVLIAPFNSSADFSAGWQSPRRARGALDKLRARGGTALYDALAQAAERFPRGDARRVILLLSDGRDERADGLAPGSARTADEALKAALRADATVVSVGLGAGFAEEMDFAGMTPVRTLLEQWAAGSGGRFYLQPDARALGESFTGALRDLREEYLLIFKSGVRRPGEVTLRVEVAGRQTFHRPAFTIEPDEDD